MGSLEEGGVGPVWAPGPHPLVTHPWCDGYQSGGLSRVCRDTIRVSKAVAGGWWGGRGSTWGGHTGPS